MLIGLIVVAIITFVLAVNLEAASVLGKRAPRAYEGFSAAFGLIAVSAALAAVVICIAIVLGLGEITDPITQDGARIRDRRQPRIGAASCGSGPGRYPIR